MIFGSRILRCSAPSGSARVLELGAIGGQRPIRGSVGPSLSATVYPRATIPDRSLGLGTSSSPTSSLISKKRTSSLNFTPNHPVLRFRGTIAPSNPLRAQLATSKAPPVSVSTPIFTAASKKLGATGGHTKKLGSTGPLAPL